jgi:hypothetical protein
LYQPRAGRWQPTGKETRINRVGSIEGIVERVVERMRAAWAKAAKPACCNRCGAPLFLSKRGNMVCAEICWA